ncbi:iron ABC transporter substrate-binding protein [Candidatus Bipolaricaulota bacterium]|nr:iron ABC transporter substrate-binding protein [Candidatus Bipolaricaulota bacterium]
MKSKVSWQVILILVLVFAVSFVAGYPSTQDTAVVEDDLGRTVSVPEDVERIVGLEAGTLRLITYLKATEMVVGVENFEKRDKKRPYRLAHPELAELQSIGPIHGGDSELIVSAQPEVIFWTYTTKGKANDLQNKTGIPVIGLNYGGANSVARDDFYSALRLMGRILDKESRAEEVINFVEEEITELRERVEGPEKSGPSAFVGGIGYRGAHGVASTEPSYPPFSFLGIDNVAGELGLDHVMINEEKLLQWNPEYIFIDEAGLSLVKEDLKEPQFRGLSAIESGNVYGLLPYNYYATNFGTVLADAYYIGKLIYPEAFSGIDPEEEADRIFEFLVGDGVYSRMERIFGGFGQLELND